MLFSPFEQFRILPFFYFFSNYDLIYIYILISLILIIKINKNQFIPFYFQKIIEKLFVIILKLSETNIIGVGNLFFPLIFSIFFFILLSNWLGLFPYSFTITSHLILVFNITLFLFIGLNIFGISNLQLKFLKIFFPSSVESNILLLFLLVPIELISYLFRLISLSVRLFSNLMSGHVLIKIILNFLFIFFKLNILLFISLFPLLILLCLVYLEVVISFIQAYVFTILLAMYINDSINFHN